LIAVDYAGYSSAFKRTLCISYRTALYQRIAWKGILTAE